jgi:hypothetical protein
MKRRKSAPFPTKRVLTIVGSSTLFLLLVAVSYDQFDKWRYRPSTTFNAEKWNRPDRKYRFSVTDYVIQQVVKPGMTETQVIELLGTPNAITANEDYQYETQHPGLRSLNWTGGGILIKFDPDRRVIEAFDETLHD